MNLPKFSVGRPVTTMMTILMIFIFGLLSFSRLSVDLLPDIEFPMISVATSYNGVMPEDIEDAVSKKIEDAVVTVEGVKSISSTSQEGLSMVMIEFESDVDVDIAAQNVRDKISMIENYLPSGADKPVVVKADLGAMPVLMYGVSAEGVDVLDLGEALEDNLKDKLERLDGVASVAIQGAGEREIQVVVEKTKLEFYGLNQSQIVSVLGAENVNNSGGFIEQVNQEFSIRTLGEYDNIEDIENVIVSLKDGIPIYLKDVASVSWGQKERRSYVRTNQNASVLLSISKQSGANTVEVVQAVKEELPNLKKYLPENTEFFLAMDQSRTINASIDSTKQSGIIGAILAMIVVFMFLRNWRPTLVIGLGIPLSVIATFIPIYGAGYTLNIMTLGGLALGIGMLVDNSVVVIENIFRHLDKSGKRKYAAIFGTNEVLSAIIASTITTIAVFIPMALATGIAGQLSRGLALTVIFSLICSLFVAVTAVPMIASKVFRDKKKRGFSEESSDEAEFFVKIKGFYKSILQWSLLHRGRVMIITLGLFFLSLGLVPFIGAEFMAESEQGMSLVQLSMPVGTSLEETKEVTKEIENIINDKIASELISVTAIIGENENSADGGGIGGGANNATMLLRFKDKKDKTMSEKEAIELVRRNVPPIRGLELTVMDMSSAMMGGGSNPIEIKILGSNLEELKEFASVVSNNIKDVEGVRDVDIDYNEGKPELQIKIDRERATHLGLSVGQIGQEVKNSMQGVLATQLRTDGDEINVRVRLDENYRDDFEAIKDLVITSSKGEAIALDQVATILEGKGPSEINREDQLRVISVTANIFERDINSIVKDIQLKMEGEFVPEGVYLEYGGSYEQMGDTFSALALALLLAVVLVYMVMAAQFESFLYPLLVMFEVPMAFIGVALILFATGMALSLPAFMGLIMLAGIVVNNAIVLIDYINQLRDQGMSLDKSLLEAGISRLRPILITSITTLLGLIPMALSTAEGSELMKPMAIVVIGGLLISTVLTLVVIPVLYSLVDKFSKRDFKKKEA